VVAGHSGLVVAGTYQVYFGAELPHCLHLGRVCVGRGADDGLDAEQLRCVCNRLTVIPGRGCDHPSLALLGAELGDEIHASAHFEGAGGEVVLQLQVDLRAKHLADRGRVPERSGGQVGPDAPHCSHRVANGRFGEHRLSLTSPDWVKSEPNLPLPFRGEG